ISNPDVDDFTAIVDPPRTCILAIGGVTRRTATDDIDDLSHKSSHVESQNSSSIDIIDYLTGTLPKAPQVIKSVESENVKASQIVSAKLSIDERVIDTTTGSKFLERISYYIQNPQKMIT
ncbi:10363_t:CDS:1, partial [Paraglomus occultum]